jgi:uncharacterized protein involved in exopolysaccharide biosynthesis
MSDLNPAHQRSGDERLAFYWRVLQRWWWTILVCTLIAPVITAVVSATLVTRSYRAEAAIKPLPSQNSLSERTVFQNLSSALGQNVAEQAKEYVSILQSFTFAKWVVRHDPVVYSMLFSRAEGARLQSRPTAEAEWKAYKRISRNLTCYYDNTGGLLRLRYVADDRETAEKVLTILVNDLIADVRDRDIASYSAQIKSLEAHANRTSDELLRADLYEIIARRMEQLSTAEASALTAFRTIEAPYVPREPYKPRPLLYAAATAATMPIVLFTLIVMLERSRAFIREQSVERTLLSNGLDQTDSALKAPVSMQDPFDPG